MIEAKFAFFQVMKKLVSTQAVELLHAAFGKGPKTLDTVDMIGARSKLIRSVIDPQMLGKTDFREAVVAGPLVGVDDHFESAFITNNGLQRELSAIGNDLGIDPSVSLVNAENDGLAARPATAFAANPTAAKIRLVDLDFASLDRSVPSTFFDQANTDLLKNTIDTFPGNIRQLSRLAGRQI